MTACLSGRASVYCFLDEAEPHLLVVDDDARVRGPPRHYLTDQGFRVTAAAEARVQQRFVMPKLDTVLQQAAR